MNESNQALIDASNRLRLAIEKRAVIRHEHDEAEAAWHGLQDRLGECDREVRMARTALLKAGGDQIIDIGAAT